MRTELIGDDVDFNCWYGNGPAVRMGHDGPIGSHQIESVIAMRTDRCLFLMAVVLCLVQPQARGQACSTPSGQTSVDDVVHEVWRAVRSQDWRTLVGYAHPLALSEFRQEVLLAMSYLGEREYPQGMRDRYLTLVFGVESVADLIALSSESLFERILEARALADRSFSAVPRRVVGKVVDGDSLAFVLMVLDLGSSLNEYLDSGRGLSWPNFEIMSLRRDRLKCWKSMLDGGLYWTLERSSSLPGLGDSRHH